MEVRRKLSWFIWKLVVILKRFQSRSKKYQLFVYMCLITFCLTNIYLFTPLIFAEVPDQDESFRFVQQQLWDSIGSDSEDIGCMFPVLDPYSEEAMKFTRNVSKITCKGEDWVDCYLSECRVKTEILKRFKNVACIYKDIIYINDKNYFNGAATRVIGDGKYYLNKSDHVKVSCSGIDKNGLGLMATRWFGYKAGFRPIDRKIPPGREHSMNVLILGLDSSSRFGVMRRLPRSFHVLTEELQGTVLKGFHIVGDGTPATLFPLLSGKTQLEHPYAMKTFINGQFLDPKLFIFHDVKAHGYHTAYFEDSPWIGTFQYRYNGFSASPADHYLYAFFHKNVRLGLGALVGSKYCQGATPRYLFMLNLTKQLFDVEGKRFCFTFIADISHDDYNMITAADDDLAEFLREFKKSGKLNDTLLIVMGDHGSRFNQFRETYQGKIEERLPFIAIVLPEKLKQERPEAVSVLKENDNVLITPFDIHTTILDVIGLKYLANGFKVPGSNLPRAISLLERIPKSRNCGQAAILSHWCVCTKWTNVSVNDFMYTRVAMYMAQFINNITLQQRALCAERILISIEWVMRHGTNADVLKFRRGMDAAGQFAVFLTNAHGVKPFVEEYQAKIMMNPGRAVYESSLKYYVREDRFVMSEAEISRITAYRNEPHCVSKTQPHLNKYCYCKNKSVTKDEED